jgi:16S rRNA U516 pseudouridylate synthase RsuA-like enzyme
MVVGRTANFAERNSMGKPKRKLTPAEKRARQKRRKEFMIVFVNGKQVRVRRPVTIDGIGVDDFIRANADPIWLHQNGLWEYMSEGDEV